MTSTRSNKTITGPEFVVTDELDIGDISDWVIGGTGVESIKTVLDDFEWNGDSVATIILKTSPDNKKIVNGSVSMMGELMKSPKEIRASRLFAEADKDLKITYNIEDASVFTFKSGTMVGDIVDDSEITWGVIRKTSRRTWNQQTSRRTTSETSV